MEGLVLVGQWTSAAALQGEAANHPELLRSRVVVVSVAGKVALPARQVWAKKASASEPLMTRRKGPIDDIETRPERTAWDEPGGSLLTGQAVSGVEVARAWSGLRCGTCEPVVPRPRAASGASPGPRPSVEGRPPSGRSARGRVPMRGTGADRLVLALKPGNAGGAKETGRPGSLGGQPSHTGGAE